ncbi:MAG: hypothetical protein IEMM0001_0632 [bacterium]|nr:MAG: hypothetical protein IEMM0001_0632 [bacterium]
MSPDEARAFLFDFKGAVTAGSGVYLIPRDANRQTLNYLGLTKRNLEEILLDLTVLDYCKGPKDDRDQPGEIWEFGKNVKDEDIYIKLKVAEVNGKKIAKCISFHIAKYKLQYPYKS